MPRMEHESFLFVQLMNYSEECLIFLIQLLLLPLRLCSLPRVGEVKPS